MKLMSLNIWGAHVREPFVQFIPSQQDIDIFCFQEVYHQASNKISTDDRDVHLEIFSELGDLLPNHQGYFRPVVDNIYGIGMFMKKSIDVIGEGEVWIHENTKYPGNGPRHSRNLQWLEFYKKNQVYSVMNVHGLWNGKGKGDSPDRINQSKRIREFMDTINTPKILCGDFNLRPDTESLKIVAEGMTDLIQVNNITSTRTSHYSKPEKFADYVFASPEITANTFEVLQDEVSDHAPLVLDFS